MSPIFNRECMIRRLRKAYFDTYAKTAGSMGCDNLCWGAVADEVLKMDAENKLITTPGMAAYTEWYKHGCTYGNVDIWEKIAAAAIKVAKERDQENQSPGIPSTCSAP